MSPWMWVLLGVVIFLIVGDIVFDVFLRPYRQSDDFLEYTKTIPVDKPDPDSTLVWTCSDTGVETLVPRESLTPTGKTAPQSAYERRTDKEHAEIRARIKVDPKDCNHAKGGPTWNSPYIGDYNLSLFTFIDGTQRIRCLTCGQKWFKGDKGWKEMYEKAQQRSTNKEGSSEQVPDVKNQLRNIMRRKGRKKPDRKWFRR